MPNYKKDLRKEVFFLCIIYVIYVRESIVLVLEF